MYSFPRLKKPATNAVADLVKNYAPLFQMAQPASACAISIA